MKKAVMLLGCILMLLVSSAFAQDEIPIYINDVLLENSPPVLDFSEYRLASDSTPRYEAKLPLRAVFEGIGATVEWIPKNGNIRISMDSKSILCDTYSNYIDAIDELTGKYIVLEGYLHHGYYWNIDGNAYIDFDSASSLLHCFKHNSIVSAEDTLRINIYPYTPGTTALQRKTIDGPPTYFVTGGTIKLVPVRAVFEALGAKVTWLPESGYTRIEYKNRSFLFELKPVNSHIPLNYDSILEPIREDYLFIKDESTSEYLDFGKMPYFFPFWNIDGHMYIPDWVFSNFIDMFGFGITSDEDNHIINISRKKY